MLRLLVVAASLLLAGCAEGESPSIGAGSVEGDVEVRSNETTDAATPRLNAVADVDTTGAASITVAGETVPTRAVVTGMESGDRSCYLSLRTDSGGTATVHADYSVCDSDAIVDRRVQIEYQESNVLAASCQEDADCLDTETVALAVVAEPIGG